MINGYKKLDNGVIKQLKPSKYNYNKNYVADRYDSYGELCDMMSYLRLGYICGVIGEPIDSVLDVGYGNGSFLKICQKGNIKTYGSDVSGYKLKYGQDVEFHAVLDRLKFDLITFFDSLEHIYDISFLSKLECKYICISVPYCHYNDILEKNGEKVADDYFENWKHRRLDEHIWHFNDSSLCRFMSENGYVNIQLANIEDLIRKSTDGKINILTAIFKKI